MRAVGAKGGDALSNTNAGGRWDTIASIRTIWGRGCTMAGDTTSTIGAIDTVVAKWRGHNNKKGPWVQWSGNNTRTIGTRLGP